MKGCGTSVTPVIAGVRSDIERLLQKFIETPSVRFEHFSECFREAKFSLIFSGRTSENEIREFSEKILLTAVLFCFPPYNFHVSVGGLYLLYALYYLQPKKYRMQIRVTPEQFDTLKVFLQTLSEQQHLDSCYVLHKLLRDQAFYICVYSDEHNPLNFHRFDNKEDAEKAAETLRNSQTFVHELANDNLIPQLKTIHDQYIILKKRLVNDDNLPDALALVDKNPMEYVKNVIDECEEKLERRLGVKKKIVNANTNGDPAPSDLTSQQKLKERRKNIKELAYRSIGKQPRHVRYRQEIASATTVSKTVQPLFPTPLMDKRRVRRRESTSPLADIVDDLPSAPIVSVSKTVQPPVSIPLANKRRGRPRKPSSPSAADKEGDLLLAPIISESKTVQPSVSTLVADKRRGLPRNSSSPLADIKVDALPSAPIVSASNTVQPLPTPLAVKRRRRRRQSSSPSAAIEEDELPLSKIKVNVLSNKKIHLENV